MFKITVPSLGVSYFQENPTYVKYQKKNNIMVICEKEEAQGIVSIDGSRIYQFDETEQLKEKYPVCQIEKINSESVLNMFNEQFMAMEAGVNEVLEGVE